MVNEMDFNVRNRKQALNFYYFKYSIVSLVHYIHTFVLITLD